jgi:alanyl-tRNA synthetase
MTGNELRKSFLEFFRRRGHLIKPSWPLVPPDDPTLLFTSAGMVQFKKEFLAETPPAFTRAATCQKCFRTSDIDNVGKTTRHHTFFEMLGNFSFGDYFKEESIGWGWEYVTKELGLPENRLWVSIFRDDDEAFDIWKELITPDRILRMDEKDNFWAMGPTGPCGPCSEIYYDYGEGVGCGRPGCLPGCDCDRYVEIWNHVFTQFDRQTDGSLKPLPKKNIDTGMGLERIAAVMQGTTSNFDTDLFKSIIEYTASLTGVDPADAVEKYRVIADHIRALTFLITDGVLPSNEGRGYVERRILRRAVQRGRDLGMQEPFLYRIVGTVVETYKDAYPELEAKREHISHVIKTEEERFHETLSQGLTLLNDIMDDLQKAGKREISGRQLFRLYDTYGFPVELTEEIAVSKGYELDKNGFDAEMQSQRERARAAFTGYEAAGELRVYAELAQKLRPSEFVGYTQLQTESKVTALLVNGSPVESIEGDAEAEAVLDITPFYSESGGQVGDKGRLTGTGLEAEVTDTKQPTGELIVHKVRLKKGILRVGAKVLAQVDESLRRDTAAHHSATHLLQSALREVIGEHVYQAGSLVAPDRFRFDYAHFTAPDKRQLKRVEALLNERIRENLPVQAVTVPFDEAKKHGAIALFGEKYGDRVRMVKMGEVSKELCGGTHVHSTGDIGLCILTSESSVAAGVRRIEAVCGSAAYRRAREDEDMLQEMSLYVNAPREAIPERIRQLLEEKKKIEKELTRLKKAVVADKVDDLIAEAVDVDGVKVLAVRLDDQDVSHLRNTADSLKAKLRSGVVVIGGVTEGKVLLIASVTKDLTGKVHAGDLVKDVAKIVGGGGGGRPDMAQAGGKDPSKLEEALGKVPKSVERMIKAREAVKG